MKSFIRNIKKTLKDSVEKTKVLILTKAPVEETKKESGKK